MEVGYIKGIGRATFIYKFIYKDYIYNVNITFRVYLLRTKVIEIYSIAGGCFKGLIVLSITYLVFNIQVIRRGYIVGR